MLQTGQSIARFGQRTPPSPAEIWCCLYLRFSSDLSRPTSTDDQKYEILEFLKLRNRSSFDGQVWKVLGGHVYEDREVPGSTDDRESYNSMISIALSGNCPFQYILVYDTSRLWRDLPEQIILCRRLRFKGVYVYFLVQEIDTRSENWEDDIMLPASSDQRRLREIAKGTWRGLRGQLIRGFSAGGRIYGYRSKPQHSGRKDRYGDEKADGYVRTIVKDEARIVRKVFVRFGLEKMSPIKIARTLNKEIKAAGIENAGPLLPLRSKEWSAQSIYCMLRQEVYVGILTWNKTHTVIHPETRKKVSRPNDPEKWVRVPRPELKIISNLLWLHVQKRLAVLKERTTGRYKSDKKLASKNLLTAVTKCGLCGGTFGVTSGGRVGKYGCTNEWNYHTCGSTLKLPKKALEEFVVNAVEVALEARANTEDLLSTINRNLQNFFGRVFQPHVDEEIRQDIARADELMESFQSSGRTGTDRQMEGFLRQLREKLGKEQELASLQLKTSPADPISLTELEAYFGETASRLVKNPTPANLQEIVDSIFITPTTEGVIVITIAERTTGVRKLVLGHLSKADERLDAFDIVPYSTREFEIRVILDKKRIKQIRAVEQTKCS
jgi:DNA invertase Pin-like site-specific DNA recombinase